MCVCVCVCVSSCNFNATSPMCIMGVMPTFNKWPCARQSVSDSIPLKSLRANEHGYVRRYNKVRAYHERLFEISRGLDPNSLFEGLPNEIKGVINRARYKEGVSHVALFKDCDPAFLDALCNEVQPQICLPGDNVVRQGDPGFEMFCIHSGTVDCVDVRTANFSVVQLTFIHSFIHSFIRVAAASSVDSHIIAFAATCIHSWMPLGGQVSGMGGELTLFLRCVYEGGGGAQSMGHVIASMGPGQVIGEVSLFTSLPRSLSVVASTYTELYALHKDNLDRVLGFFPREGEKFRRIARTRVEVCSSGGGFFPFGCVSCVCICLCV